MVNLNLANADFQGFMKMFRQALQALRSKLMAAMSYTCHVQFLYSVVQLSK